MTKIQIAEYDHVTGENIVRDATDEEIEAMAAQAAQTQLDRDAREGEAANKLAAKQAVLAKLGLTDEEAAALLA